MMRFRKGDVVFQEGDESDKMFIMMVGEISLYVPLNAVEERQGRRSGTYWNRGEGRQESESQLGQGKLIQRARYGSFFGDLHFLLHNEREFNALATEDAAVFYITRSRLQELRKQHPRLALGFIECISKSLSLSVSDSQIYGRAK
mmetsp:Transcript_11606/g.21565  ORF Transcript_11606/g.21565 Transcript_11606/m.21565 type:complete len:145 (+) Transcript_11606:1-435(+)